ncbi:MAG: FtsQ-type POTRA domain-containing protein [Vicinamibacterales bacterium]
MSRRASTMRRGLPGAPGVAAHADRRFRRAEVAPNRQRRYGRTVWRVARWALPAVLVAALLGWGARTAMSSDSFAVRRFIVQGNSRLSEGDVLALVAGLRGQNILRADLDRYRSQLMSSLWVGQVTLWRVLPSTIGIRVVERVPMALARIGTQLFLVDDTGIVIDEYSSAYRDIDLPVVDGMSPAGSKGRALRLDTVRLTTALMGDLSHRASLLQAISQIDVSNPHDARVMLTNDDVWLHLGESRFGDRLERYLELRPTFHERFEEVDYVDLRFDDRIYVHRPEKGRRVAGGVH